MSHKTVQMLKDIDGNLIPQFYDERDGVFKALSPLPESLEAKIVAGETKTGVLCPLGFRVSRILGPENLTTAAFRVHHSFTAGGTFRVLTDDYADEDIAIRVKAGKESPCGYYAASLTGLSFIKLESVDESDKSTAVAQVGTKASLAITVDTGKVLTIGSGVGGPGANALQVAIGTAADDVLAVSAAGGLITILLANSTASNNSAANIQAALRDLGTVDGIDVSAMTAVGDTGYDAAPPIAASVGAANLAGGDDTTLYVILERV